MIYSSALKTNAYFRIFFTYYENARQFSYSPLLWKRIESTRHKLWFSKSYIFANQCRRYFKLCIYFESNNLNLKYLRFTDLQVANTEGLKHLSSWQSLNSFTSSLKNVNKKCSGTKERRCRFTFVTSYWFLNKGIESLPQT